MGNRSISKELKPYITNTAGPFLLNRNAIRDFDGECIPLNGYYISFGRYHYFVGKVFNLNTMITNLLFYATYKTLSSTMSDVEFKTNDIKIKQLGNVFGLARYGYFSTIEELLTFCKLAQNREDLHNITEELIASKFTKEIASKILCVLPKELCGIVSEYCDPKELLKVKYDKDCMIRDILDIYESNFCRWYQKYELGVIDHVKNVVNTLIG